MDKLLDYFPKTIVEIICTLSNPTYLELLETHFSKQYVEKLNESRNFRHDINKILHAKVIAWYDEAGNEYLDAWIGGIIVFQYHDYYIIHDWGPRNKQLYGRSTFDVYDNDYDFCQDCFIVKHKMIFDYKKLFRSIYTPYSNGVLDHLSFILDFFRNIPHLGLSEFEKYMKEVYLENIDNPRPVYRMC